MSGSDEAPSSGEPAVLMSPAQSRAARAMLDWPVATLAAKVGLDEGALRGFEEGNSDLPAGRIEAMRSALMAAGIAFLDGDAPGVRLQNYSGGEGTRLDALTTENDR